jgi:hypothetical protein
MALLCGLGLVHCGGETPGRFVGGADSGAVATDARADAPADAGPAPACARQTDCDDGLACTDDACVIGGRCEHAPVQSRCPADQRCFPGQGCAATRACSSSAGCDDGVPCTQDLCVAGGTCQSVRDDSRCGPGMACLATGCAAMGRCGADGDCDDRVFCNGVERCAGGACAAGTAPDCGDGDPCTGDICTESMARCEHPPIAMCGGGAVTSGAYALAPAIRYSCGAGTIGPISQVTLAVAAGSVTVTGFPAALSGPAPSGGMFTASGSESRGGCQWRYTLSGSFTAEGRFTGSYNLAFDSCVVTLGCFAQFGEVSGTRR